MGWLADFFRPRSNAPTPWHPLRNPYIPPEYWHGWPAPISPGGLALAPAPPTFHVYPYPLYEKVPDGDVLYSVQLQGAWQPAALTTVRESLHILLPLRHLVVPHAKALASVYAHCGARPAAPSQEATAQARTDALRVATRLLAAVLRGFALHFAPPSPIPDRRGLVCPGSFATLERLIGLVEDQLSFTTPSLFGIPYPQQSPNVATWTIQDYGEHPGWAKWRHGWGHDLRGDPLSYLDGQYKPGAEDYRELLEKLLAF